MKNHLFGKILITLLLVSPAAVSQVPAPTPSARVQRMSGGRLPAAAAAPAADYAFPGELRMFAGQRCPANWLLADGKEYPDQGHAKLVAAIGDLWGASGVGKFKVPDLRGTFVRGWNAGRDANSGDPDAQGRTIPTGAPIDPARHGDQVGSSQGDVFGSHSHGVALTRRWGDRYGDAFGWGGDNGEVPGGPVGVGTTSAGGAETRPRNVYVLFCVRDGN